MVSFSQVGAFKGTQGGPNVIDNPTSLQFGPDGRLYVAEQGGSINAFTITVQDGEYVATAHELLTLANGAEVVKSIQNHNDDGTENGNDDRQVTGIIVAGTAAEPVLYISSSDPRISKNGEVNLDTNSGVVTKVSWNSATNQWEQVDLIRGLPRSEENHSVNGMALSPDGTKLYLAVGGNTNNGAPSAFFSYTGEYTLSGTTLEIDLEALDDLPTLVDADGGQGNLPRNYKYDLPTLDDPNIPNVTNGVGEDANGLDEAGPWGGNDGLNQAILPEDAPLRIYADGFRNHYDLVFTESGKLYTVDNGSNGNLGGDPVFVDGEVTNLPNNGGSGDPEPLFLIEDGGYYGHPVPVRSNQDLAWTVYDDDGNPDTTLDTNTVSDLSDLVPDSVSIENGFLIDPSKFTGNSDRLEQSGVRIKRTSNQSNTLENIGSSSNGLVEYTGDAFNGELKGDLLVAQFNGSVGRLNLDADGTTATYETIPGLSGLSTPLDVTIGPNGTVWVAEIGGDFIKAFAPNDGTVIVDNDADDDGILDVDDPFLQDASNGTAVVVLPNQPLLWDFDANQDDNLPGPDGYGGGLTGVMINGVTNFTEFFQSPSDFPEQNIKLDNVKFITAAGGGTTVVENVSTGDAFTTGNDGEYLFHTGVKVATGVEAVNIRWTVFNPGGTQDPFVGPFQQIGGYIGTGDQSNYLKIVAIEGSPGEFQILLEDDDVVQSSTFLQADDLFSNAASNGKISFYISIDIASQTATPTITYDTNTGVKAVTGEPINLSGTAVWDAIAGNASVQGQETGLAVGLYSSNTGQPVANTFQAVFDDIEITARGNTGATTVLYRVNAGGPEVAALDGGPAWSADTQANNSSFLASAGSGNVATFNVQPGPSVDENVPAAIFQTERWDAPGGTAMQWAFDAPEAGQYEVRLYLGNGFAGTGDVGERIFDVAIEGEVLPNTDDIDLVDEFGQLTGGVITNLVNVTDGTINIDFLHEVENPLINGIEILKIGDDISPPIALNDSFETDENSILTGNVLVDNGNGADSDPDGDALTVSEVNGTAVTIGQSLTLSSGALLTLNADGTFSYDPNGQFDDLSGTETASDSFSYTVSDGNGGTDTATVDITIGASAVLPIEPSAMPFFGFEAALAVAAADGVNLPYTPVEVGGLNLGQFFDSGYYLHENPDVAAAVANGTFITAFDHFIQHGWLEGRDGSVLFNEEAYVEAYDDVEAAIARNEFSSGFQHFALYGHLENREPGSVFSQDDYLTKHLDVARAVDRGEFGSAFEHYIEFGALEGREPELSLFQNDYYLETNPDVFAGIIRGDVASGFDHFVQFGIGEKRQPSPFYNEDAYLAANPDVERAVASGQMPSGFLHYVVFGAAEGRDLA